MKRYQRFLLIFLLVCILANCTGCFSRNNYTVFSDKNHRITMVGGTMRDQIGIVLDNRELVICSYKGKELCRKSFDKEIRYMDIYAEQALLLFEDDTVEMYSVENEAFDMVLAHSFDSSVKKIDVFDWLINKNKGAFVLLENGELWRTESENSLGTLVLMDKGVQAEAYIEHQLTYITVEGEIRGWCGGAYFEADNLIPTSTLKDIYDLRVATSDGAELLFGYGREHSYFIDILGDYSLKKTIENSEIEPIYSSKSMYYSTVYRENGQWYFEGTAKDYTHPVFRKDRKSIKVASGESVWVVAGGVLIYDDHEVRIQLISPY